MKINVDIKVTTVFAIMNRNNDNNNYNEYEIE